MTTPLPLQHDIQHVTPVSCPECLSAMAHLVRVGPDAFRRDGKTEIWLFRCERCGNEFSQTVET